MDPSFCYPYRSELPAIWSDISNAIQGFKDLSTTRIVLDEGLGLELSKLGQLLKLRPGLGDEHQLVQQLANRLWFRQTDYVRDERGNLVRRNSLSTEEDLKAMALRTKPHTNLWLYLPPRLCASGQDAFHHAPAVVREIVSCIYQQLLPKGIEERDSQLHEGYQDIVRWPCAGLELALYVTFGHENSVKRPLVIYTQELADLRLDGHLTLIAMTNGRLVDLFVQIRYPEQLQGTKREFDAQMKTSSYRKLNDWRTFLLQYLIQQNRSLAGEDKPISSKSEMNRCGVMPLCDRLGSDDAYRSTRSDLRFERICN